MKHSIIYISLFFFAFVIASCGDDKEQSKTIDEFVTYSKGFQLEKLKTICTENTQFYMRMTLEPLMSLGEESTKEQLRNMASTIECRGEGDRRNCSFINFNGQKQSFELSLVNNERGGAKYLIDIDKKFFLGE